MTKHKKKDSWNGQGEKIVLRAQEQSKLFSSLLFTRSLMNYFHFIKRHKNDEPLIEAVAPQGL